jgi:hypothetical protein
MVLEPRALGSPTLPTSRLHGVFGQEEGHVHHEVITVADSDSPLRSFRLRVRISINLWEPLAEVSWGLQVLLAPTVAPGV